MNGFHRSFLRVSSPFLTKALSTTAKPQYPVLEVVVRPASKIGSRYSRYFRKDKNIPGVIYGTDSDRNVLKRLVTIKQKDLQRELRLQGMSFENTVYELVVKREVEVDTSAVVAATPNTSAPAPQIEEIDRMLVTPRQTQFNPVSDLPVSVNFLKYNPGNRVRIPIEFANEDASQDMRRGCFLVRVNNFLECVCDEEVPVKITVDLSAAKKGDVIRLSSLQLPPKVRPSKRVPLDYVLAVVQSSRG